MKKQNSSVLIALVILVSALSSYAGYRYSSLQENEQQTTQIRPEFAMADINGQIRNIKEWDGKIILLNFWATWCPPCLHEIPGFIELQEQYGSQGFQIIGVAVDNEDAVREFVNEMNINYPVMASEIEAIKLSNLYGNSMNGLPFSVIINREGEISSKITGVLSKIRAEEILKNLGLKS